jgi:hypothetical protein
MSTNRAFEEVIKDNSMFYVVAKIIISKLCSTHYFLTNTMLDSSFLAGLKEYLESI